jgi:hypothetical protein
VQVSLADIEANEQDYTSISLSLTFRLNPFVCGHDLCCELWPDRLNRDCFRFNIKSSRRISPGPAVISVRHPKMKHDKKGITHSNVT